MPILAPGYTLKTFLGGQDGGSGQLVGNAFDRWQGVAGGAFATQEDITAARAARDLNAVAVRKRAQQKRGGLVARGARVAVTGAMTVARPTARSVGA